jgi:hypothetical protein
MAWTIELPPETERQLEQEAARRGQDPRELARALLEEKLASLGDRSVARVEALFADLPRATPEEVQAFLKAEGAQPIEHFEELLGDFWPEGESVDEFLEARRRWQWEGDPGFPWRRPEKGGPERTRK